MTKPALISTCEPWRTGRARSACSRAVLIVGLFAAWSVNAQPRLPVVAASQWQPFTASDGLTWRLRTMLDAQLAGDRVAFERERNNGEAVFDAQGRLEVQLDLAPGVRPSTVADAELRRFGGEVAVRGLDVMDVRISLTALPALLAALGSRVLVARLPPRPHLLGVGKSVSEGAEQVAPPQALACTGNDGAGVKVVVLDAGFDKWQASIDDGELPNTEGVPAQGGGTHGTMCAQVVADVAPGATILPVTGGSYAGIQKLVADVEVGKLGAVRVISHSVIWFGMSFGRHEGPVCKLTDRARKAGIAWVNASGNSGGGGFWTGIWADSDNEGHQDMGPAAASGGNINYLRFRHFGGEIKIVLDWDDYTLRETDLDLHLFREAAGTLEEVSKSTQQQGQFVVPLEQIVEPSAKAGNYVVVVAGKKTRAGLRLRIVNLGGGAGSFSVWHGAGNVYDPGSCDGVLTVGALPHNNWASGKLADYSSFGPTVDGRPKPEVVAPTQVSTSVGGFGGTSAACPHAAGAVALALAMTEASADDVVAAIIARADPIGPFVPHPAWGWGRVVLDAALAGSECVANSGNHACTTTCGTAGVQACGATCRLTACVAEEIDCNAIDDDCDGKTDGGADDACSDGGATGDAAAADGVVNDAAGADAAAGDGVTRASDDGSSADGSSADSLSPAPPVKSPDSGCNAVDSTMPTQRALSALWLALFCGLGIAARRQRT